MSRNGSLANGFRSSKSSAKWFDYYENEFLLPLQMFTSTMDFAAGEWERRHVKLAILSSGVNWSVLGLERHDLRPHVNFRSFVEDDPEALDKIGIGTQAASLLLKLAPSAEVHALKVTSTGNIKSFTPIVEVSSPGPRTH